MPVLKNYLEPCRLAFSPVLQHEAHDELVRNAEPLVRALSTPRPHHSSHMDMDFHEALLVKVLDYADLLNAALPIDAQLDAHIGNGVTLYLAGSGHTLIGLAMPHDHSDEEVAALVDHIKAGGVYVCDGKVSDCALQPAVNNVSALRSL